MEEEILKKNLSDMNRGIISCRGIYSRWAAEHGLGYNELLVLYTIREKGFCTQKQISDQYLIPRQTMNHVIGSFREKGVLAKSERLSKGREQAFVLTPEGQKWAHPFLEALDRGEKSAAEKLGTERLQKLTQLMLEYDAALYESFF